MSAVLDRAEKRAQQLKALEIARKDFAFYAPRHLKILDKNTSALQPFGFNKPQQIVHQKSEQMLRETGYVRLICVKARQQGISTYINGRGYWRTSLNMHWRSEILTHLDEATKNMLLMVRRFHEHCPVALRPKTSHDAVNALAFGALDSRYGLGTARSKGTGRSATARFFHGSEVAFWSNLKDNLAGVGQVVPLAEGTEVYLESTGNGRNDFYTLVYNALSETSLQPYRVIFVPWFMSDEYQLETIPKGLDLSDDDYEYSDLYGLSLKQMAWRQFKIMGDFAGDVTLFDQEYPASLNRAFRRTPTESPFIRTQTTERARKRPHRPLGARRLGVDPSQGTDEKKDRFACVLRDDTGVISKHRLRLQTDNQYEAAGHIIKLMKELEPDITFIDRLGIGAGICDIVSEQMAEWRVVGVRASEKATDTEKYVNKRSEMWGEAREWLVDGASMIDDDELDMDLTSPSYTFRGEAYLLESKESLRKRELPSPDYGDALAHTFYMPFELAKDMDREQLRSMASAELDWRTQ